MSTKGDTNKKWTSTEEYRDNYDHIFGKKDGENPCDPCDACENRKLRAIGCICTDSVDYELMNRDDRE